MSKSMDQYEFYFGDQDEVLLPEIREIETITAGEFLRMAEGQDDEGVDELLQMLESMGTIFDISDLPRLGVSGQAALRLREEMELVRQGDLLKGLEKGDALRIYLEELAIQSEPKDLDASLRALAQANEQGQDEVAFTSPLLITGMKRVVEVAKEYVGYGVLLLDLIQEGNIGLWQCMKTDSDGPFLEEDIRQAMIRAVLRQGIATGLSEKLRRAVEDYRMADERLLMDLGRNPTPAEMAEYLHMTVEEVENVRKTLENARMVDKAHVTPEPEEEDPEDAQAVEDTAYYQTRERVSDLMSGLTALETEVLNLRYGLNGKPPLNLQETARRLNLTTTQVTQTEQNALAKMRGN